MTRAGLVADQNDLARKVPQRVQQAQAFALEALGRGAKQIRETASGIPRPGNGRSEAWARSAPPSASGSSTTRPGWRDGARDAAGCVPRSCRALRSRGDVDHLQAAVSAPVLLGEAGSCPSAPLPGSASLMNAPARDSPQRDGPWVARWQQLREDPVSSPPHRRGDPAISSAPPRMIHRQRQRRAAHRRQCAAGQGSRNSPCT